MRRFIPTLFAAALLFGGCVSVHRETTEIRGASPAEPVDYLARAAECVEKGDSTGALGHLKNHLEQRPDAPMVRAYLAELLFQTQKYAEAKPEYERFLNEAYGRGGAVEKHRIHVHTRLLEIAHETDDPFHELLHRGIGLLLMVEQWDREPSPDEGVLAESTLAKALSALREARKLKANDPRVPLYQAEVQSRLGQSSAASSSILAAKNLLPDASFGVEELRRLGKY